MVHFLYQAHAPKYKIISENTFHYCDIFFHTWKVNLFWSSYIMNMPSHLVLVLNFVDFQFRCMLFFFLNM